MAKIVRAWGPVFAIAAPALVTIAIGILGWTRDAPISLAVASGLILAGIGILASMRADSRLRGVRLACAAALAAFGVYAFLQSIIGTEVPPALRVSPPSSVAFFITGMLLAAIERPEDRARGLAVQLLVAALIALALVSFIMRDVPAEGLMPWYRLSRMASATALGFIAIGIALLALIAKAPWYETVYRGRADEKILTVGVGILSLTLLGTAAAGFVMMQRNVDEAIHDALTQSVRDRVAILDSVFDSRIIRASIVASRPAVTEAFERWAKRPSNEARARLQEEAQSYLGAGFTGVRFFDATGTPLATVGSFVQDPAIEVALTSQRAPASLLWNRAFILRVVSSVTAAGRPLGSVETEQELELLPRLQFAVSELGDTAEWVLCAGRGERMICFPTSMQRRPFESIRKLGDTPLPMDFALGGKTGVINAPDYRGERVIAGYAPVGATGLGIVLKVAAEEIYAPLRHQFAEWIQWFLGMGLLGTLLVASQIRPVAQRLVRSEHLARDRAEALARSEAGLRGLYASLGDGIVVLRPDGVIEFMNPAAEELFGYSRGDLIGKSVALLIPEGRLREANAAATSRYVEGEVSAAVGKRDMVYPAVRRDGTRFDLEFSLAEMRTAEGPRLVAVARDISERTELERMKGEFVAAVSHELRTPLTSILGSLEILREEAKLPETERGFLDMAWRNSQRLAALVNDVIDSQRLDAGTFKFDNSDFALGEFLRESVDMNQSYGKSRGITMKVDGTAPAATLHADRGRLMQVMANLLSNAAKFSPDGGEVAVRATRTADHVRVEVIDRGRGIPDEFRSRVFEKFAQADAGDSREKGGTGLGLAICKSLVEKMGGTIGFDSRVGETTTFWFELPASG